MGEELPFIGSEALADGVLSRYEIRSRHRAIMPNVYLEKRVIPTLRQRTYAAWLWSRREAVVSGLAASAMHGAKWIDDMAPVELIWRNARAPRGVVTRDALLLDGEYRQLRGMKVTTPERTAFDLARHGDVVNAVARLDALAAATGIKAPDVEAVASEHRRARGLRQLEQAVDLMDAGAQSPRETWLRLLVVRDGYPRPQTQIAVPRLDEWPYYLDMGWEDIMLAIEYDGGQHWNDPDAIAHDIKRAEYIQDLGWTVVRVMKRHRPADVLARVRRAWRSATG